MRIENDDARITRTDYWATENARHGFLYLSWNAGTARLLVPHAPWRTLMREIPPIGVSVEITRMRDAATGRDVYEIAWLDDPNSPYGIVLDTRQSDRLVPCGEAGRTVPLVCYGPGEASDSVRELRRETATYRCR